MIQKSLIFGKPYKIIDLFCGIGGIRLGFYQAFGNLIQTVFASEISQIACNVYEQNFAEKPFPDVKKISIPDLPDFDILLAGFPCQSFSNAGKRLGFDDPSGRGNLFFVIENMLRVKKPQTVFLENVRNLVTLDDGKTFQIIRDILERKLGYTIYYKIIDAQDYGLAQRRKRIYIVGFREQLEFRFPPPSRHKKFLKDILNEDPVPDELFLSQKYWEGLQKHKKRHEERGNRFGYQIKRPDMVSATLLKNANGMEWNLIRSTPSIRAWKPGLAKSLPNAEGIRRLNIKEMKKLQGFPASFSLEVSHNQARQLLGNSVPVPVIKAIAQEVLNSIQKRQKYSGKPLSTSELLVFNFFCTLNENPKLRENYFVYFFTLRSFINNLNLDLKQIHSFIRVCLEKSLFENYAHDKIIISPNIHFFKDYQKFRKQFRTYLSKVSKIYEFPMRTKKLKPKKYLTRIYDLIVKSEKNEQKKQLTLNNFL